MGCCSFDVCAYGYVTREWEVYPNGVVREIIAGPPYYYCTALLRLGERVRVVTRVAEEDEGILKELKDLNASIINLPTKSTMKSRLHYRPGGREIEVVSRADPFTLADLRFCRECIVKYIYLGPLTTEDFTLEFLEEASATAPVVLDVQGFTRRVRGSRIEYVDWSWKGEAADYVSILKLDDREGRILTGCEGVEEIIKGLSNIGFKEVLLTTSKGVNVGIEGEVFSAPYRVKEVRGRTGRGDTAIAAYTHAKIRGWDPEFSVIFTAAATSIKLMNPGPLRVGEGEVLKYVSREYGVRVEDFVQ